MQRPQRKLTSLNAEDSTGEQVGVGGHHDGGMLARVCLELGGRDDPRAAARTAGREKHDRNKANASYGQSAHSCKYTYVNKAHLGTDG